MKNIQRKGITIVTLVITIIILMVLTGAVMLTMNNTDIFGQTINTVDEHNKQAIIEQIKLEIETEMIKKVNEKGRYESLSKEETVNIIETFGTYEEDTLKLTTREKNIPIYLYEIIGIQVEEYVTAVYKDKQFTLTEKEESLSSNGYKYEYTYDNGVIWQTYTTPVTIEEQSGIKVRLVNSEGQVISNEYVVTKGAGEETVNKIKAIAVTNPPTKVAYIQGETFNSLGMQVTVTYEDNTSKVVIDYNYTPTRALRVSDRYVTISYTENGVTKQTTQSITVTNKLTAIGITSLAKTKYKQGETINKSDIEVTALYEDNTTKPVTNFTYEPTGALTAEDTSITVTYIEDGITQTTSEPIQVTYITVLEITSEPSVEFKTTYIKGESFDPTGLIVSVIYEDTNALPVTNYEIVNGENLQLGTNEIVIRYTEGGITLEKEIPITVTNNIASIAVTTPPNKTLYKDNDTFDKTGMVVTATYQYKTTKVLEENEYTVSTPTYGQNYVTITHTETGLTTTQSVTIDNSKPTVTIASNKTSPTNASEIIYTITFSENVTGFTKEDLTLSNIGTSTFAGSGKEYTLTVLTSENQNNTQSVSLAEGKCTDSVGNTNQASNTLSIAIDRVAPNNFTPTITSITDTTITVQGSTTDNNGQAITYYYSSDNGITWVPQNGTTNTSYTFTNLTSGGEYNIKMKAVDTLNNAGTTTAIATNTYVQLKNYLMLYDRGDECVDVTGGWELYGSNTGTFTKNADSLSIYRGAYTNSQHYLSVGTVNTVDLSNYYALYCYFMVDKYYYINETIPATSARNIFVYPTKDKSFGYHEDIWMGLNVDNVDLAGTNILKGETLSYLGNSGYIHYKFNMYRYISYYATSYLYDLFAVKEDNWQTWCEKGGIDASSYADLDALIADTNAINTLLNNKTAVEYMIYNCTGTVMAKCMESSDILTMIANSQYSSLITGNTQWNKFIQKFSS